jgi:hypothetical protein
LRTSIAPDAPSRQPATTARLDSASNGATRHAWRTKRPAGLAGGLYGSEI